MQGELELIMDALRHASRFLLRDYFELEKLQASIDRNNINRFVRKSCEHAQLTIGNKLSRYFKNIIFNPNQTHNLKDITSRSLVVQILDGYSNFTRAMSFFSITAMIIEKNASSEVYVSKIVINFPILGELYTMEKNKGAWLEKYNSNIQGKIRMRISGSKDLDSSIAIGTDSTASYAQLKNAKLDGAFCSIYGSANYSLVQFLAGKLDLILLRPEHYFYQLGVQALMDEVGGKYINSKSGEMICSNPTIFEQVKNNFNSH